jgi:exosome complex RNA-binding protein Csl4
MRKYNIGYEIEVQDLMDNAINKVVTVKLNNEISELFKENSFIITDILRTVNHTFVIRVNAINIPMTQFYAKLCIDNISDIELKEISDTNIINIKSQKE